MPITRRNFMTAGGLTALTLMASSCSAVSRGMAQLELPESLTDDGLSPAGHSNASFSSNGRLTSFDPLWRFFNRAGYGPRPGEIGRAADMGFETYLEEQLNPENLDDPIADLMLRNLSYYPMDTSQIVDQDFKDVALDLTIATIGRAIYSKRQLYEAMVEFWSDHFNIYVRKNKVMLPLKVIDDRDVIRPLALGKFPELLAASVQSPAMLVYLDNVHNTKGVPNENYARELLELHTMGVDAGYTQDDVQEVARALTGWGVQRRGPRQGQFRYYPEQHDDGVKQIQGMTLQAGQGQGDVQQLLDLLAEHPATANFIAFKLVRRFVADEPPASLVSKVAKTYQKTDGDIKRMLGVIFLSEHFAEAGPKLKRPYTFLISALRALNCDIGNYRSLVRWLELLGQPLFQWPAPDGYPDDTNSWASNLLPRWNFCLALLGGQIRGVRVPVRRLFERVGHQEGYEELELLARVILGRPLESNERTNLSRFLSNKLNDGDQLQVEGDALALLLASPEFQWN